MAATPDGGPAVTPTPAPSDLTGHRPNMPLGASSYANLRPALFFPLPKAEVGYALVRDFAYPIGHQLHRDIAPNIHINDDPPADDEVANSSMFDDDYDHRLAGHGAAQHHPHPFINGRPGSYSNGTGTLERLPNCTFNSEAAAAAAAAGGRLPSTDGFADLDGADAADDGQRQPAVALYDFEQENDNELPLQEGQIIHVCYPHGEGWLVAQELPSGRTGLVPENYVRLLEHVEGGAEALGLDEQLYLPDEDGEAEMDTRRESQAGVGITATPESLTEASTTASSTGKDGPAIQDSVPSKPAKPAVPSSETRTKESS